MRYLDHNTKLDQFIGLYGQDYRAGLLPEHVDMFREAGGVVRPAASGSGRSWAVMADGVAYPVVCPELIEIHTEDGPASGRCGAPATDGFCGAHAVVVAAWMAQSEAETVAWERDRG